MERLSGKLTLRPTRIGFLLRPSDKRSLRRILELCTCLWGGTYNPLIPVSPVSPKAWRRDHYGQVTGRELAQGYLRFFEPDVYVEAQAGLAAECGIEDDSRFGIEQRVVQLDDFVTERDGRGPQFVFGQSIFDLYRDLYRKDFQFQSRHPRQVLLFDGRSAEMLFFAAAAGLFPQEESLAFIREGYIDAFDAHVVQASGAAWMGAFNDGSILPFSFTRRGIERRRDHSGGPTIFVLDASSSIDVIDFWNFRQFKSDVLPVSMSWLAAQRDFLRDLVTRNYRPLPGNRHGVMINTTVEFARSIDPESAENVAKEVFGGLEKGSWTLKLWYDPIWEADTDDTVARPSRADLEVKSVDLDLHVGNDESAVRFQSLAPDFAERFSGGSARWVNVLSLTDFGGKAGLALTLPSTIKRSRKRHLRIGGLFLVSREGFVLPQKFGNHGEYLQLQKGGEVITEWLAERQIAAAPSEPGRVADQVLAAIGGFWGHIFWLTKGPSSSWIRCPRAFARIEKERWLRSIRTEPLTSTSGLIF